MFFRNVLPLAELLTVVGLYCAVALGAAAWEMAGPVGGPPEIMDKDVQIVGDKLYTRGRHQATWQRPQGGQPGRWKSVPPPNVAP